MLDGLGRLRDDSGSWPLPDGIAMRQTVRGRCLVATRDFQPGQLVLRQTPYRAVLLDEQAPARCDVTYERSGSLLRCSRSKIARYSSRQAQQAAWRDGYREECAALVACAPRVPPPTVRLAARVLWRRERERRQRGEVEVADGETVILLDTPCLSLLKPLLKSRGGASNDRTPAGG